MGKWRHTNRSEVNLPATYSFARPGDFEIGSLRSRAAARALLDQMGVGIIGRSKLTPFEIACSEHDDPRVSAISVGLAKCAEERARAYGIKLPTPEWIRHQNEVVRVADKLSGGRFSQLCISDRDEQERLRALAEDQIRGKLKGGKQGEKSFSGRSESSD